MEEMRSRRLTGVEGVRLRSLAVGGAESRAMVMRGVGGSGWR